MIYFALWSMGAQQHVHAHQQALSTDRNTARVAPLTERGE